jgi:hypothetical protein
MPLLLLIVAGGVGYYAWWKATHPFSDDPIKEALEGDRTKRFSPGIGTGAESDGGPPYVPHLGCGCGHHPHHNRHGGHRSE